MKRRERPPEGVKPRFVFLEERIDSLAFALSRWTDYAANEGPVTVPELDRMLEWANELTERLEELRDERRARLEAEPDVQADDDGEDERPWGEAVQVPAELDPASASFGLELQVPAWRPDPPLVPDAPRVPPEPVE